VAALIAFLCGDDARDITGAALPIDGGWSAL
jgi:3-hydroxybutyrate dehydrogenase